eukprot:tig00001098_g7075.t1
MAASAGPGAAELAGRLEEGLASCAKLADLDALRAALAALQADAAGAERRIGELAAADERARADLDALHRALAALEARPAAEAPAPAAGAGAVGAGLWTGFPGVELEAIAGIEAALLEAGRELVRLQAAASSAEPAVSSSAGHPAPADPAGASGAGAGSGAWTAVRAGAARLLARLASIEGDIAACSAALQPLETAAAAVAVAAATTGDSHGAAALSAAGPQLAGSRLRHCGVHAAVLRAALEALQGSGVGSGVGGAGAASPEVAEALEKLRRRLRELEARLAELESAGPPLPAAAAGVSPEPETARVASPKASGGSGANAAAAIEAGRPASRGGAAALRLANALRGEAGQERAAARLDAEAEQRAAAIAALRAALEELRSRLTKAEADARATAAAAAQKGAAAAAGGVAPPAAAGGTVGLSDIHSRLDGLGARVAALEAAGPALHLHDAMPLTPHTPHAPALGPGATGAEELARAVARLEHAKADTAMFRKLAGETADLRASLDALRGQLASDFSSLAAKSEIDSLLRALEALRESVQGQLDRKPSHEELRELRDALARLQELFDRLQGEVREDSEARRRAIKEALDRLRRHLEDKIHKLHDNLTRTDDTDYTRVGRVHYRCLGCDRPTKKMIGVPVEHVVHDALPFRPPTVPALLYDHASGRPAIGPPPGATMGTGSGASPALALPGPTSQSMLATVSNSTSSLDASPIKAIRGASPILPAVVSPSRLPGPGFASPKASSASSATERQELERVRGVAEGAAPLADLRRSEEEAARKFAAKSDLARLQDAMAALAAAQAGRGAGEGAGASPAELAALMAASAGPGRRSSPAASRRASPPAPRCPAPAPRPRARPARRRRQLADLDALRAALAALQADAAGAEQRIGELAAADERARADLDALHRALAALEARPLPRPRPGRRRRRRGGRPVGGVSRRGAGGDGGIEAALLEAGRELVRLQAAASSAEPAVSSSAGHPHLLIPLELPAPGRVPPLETAAAAVAVAAAPPEIRTGRRRWAQPARSSPALACAIAVRGGGAGAASPEVAEALEKLRRRLRELEARLAELESAGPPLPAAAAGVSPEPETARVASPSLRAPGRPCRRRRPASRRSPRRRAWRRRRRRAAPGRTRQLRSSGAAGEPRRAAALRLANALRGEAGQERAAARLDAEAEQRAAAIAALRAALEELRSRLTKAEADARAAAAAAAQKGAAAAAGGVAPPAQRAARSASPTSTRASTCARHAAEARRAAAEAGSAAGPRARVAALEAAGPALHLHDAMPLTPHTPHAPPSKDLSLACAGPGATGAEELARAVARLEHAKADTAMFRKLAGETADLRASLDALRGQLASDFSSLAAKSEIDSLLRALEALRESVQGQLDRKPSHEELRELRDALARLQELFDRSWAERGRGGAAPPAGAPGAGGEGAGELRGGVAALASKKALEEETRALAAALDELRAQLAQLPAPRCPARPPARAAASERSATGGRSWSGGAGRAGGGEGAGASPAELAALMAASAGPGAAELAGRLEEGLASCAKLADLDALRAALAALQADAAGAEQRIGELAAADERARADLDALHRALAALEARPAAEAPPGRRRRRRGAGLWAGFPAWSWRRWRGSRRRCSRPAASSSASRPPHPPLNRPFPRAARLLARLASIEGDIAACSAALQPLETAAAAVAVAAATTGDSHGAAALGAAGPQLAGSRLRHCGVHAAVLRAALEALQGSGVGGGVGGAGAASPEVAEALEKLRRRLRELEARLAELESAGPPLPAAAAGVSPEPETARVASPSLRAPGRPCRRRRPASRRSPRRRAWRREGVGRLRGERGSCDRGGAAGEPRRAAALRLANALRGEERAAARLDAEAEQRAAAIAALRAALEELRSRLTKARPTPAPPLPPPRKRAPRRQPARSPAGGSGRTVGLSDIHSRLDGLGARVAALEAAGPALHLHDAMPLTPHTPHAPALGPGATGAEELARAVARLEHAKADTAMFRKLAGETADLRASLDALRGQLASDFSSLAAKSEIDSLLRALEALRESVQGQLDRKPSHEELRELRDALARLQELFDRLQGEVREDSEARRRAIKEALDRLRRHLEDKIHKLHDNLTRTDDTDYTRVAQVQDGCTTGAWGAIVQQKDDRCSVEHVVHDALPFRPPTVPALLYDHASGRPAIGPPPGATMGTGSGASPALALPGPTSQSMLATVSNSTPSLDASPIKAIWGASPILPAVVSPSRLPGPGFASPKGAS